MKKWVALHVSLGPGSKHGQRKLEYIVKNPRVKKIPDDTKWKGNVGWFSVGNQRLFIIPQWYDSINKVLLLERPIIQTSQRKLYNSKGRNCRERMIFQTWITKVTRTFLQHPHDGKKDKSNTLFGKEREVDDHGFRESEKDPLLMSWAEEDRYLNEGPCL